MLIRMEGWHLVAQAPRDHLVNRGGMLAGTHVALPEGKAAIYASGTYIL
jgi:hypothetical protein